MDKIENAKTEEEEVKVPMLEKANKADEIKNGNQKSEKPQCTRENGKDSGAKLKGNPKMEYLRANKGLISIVLISAAIIFAVVVAMLANRETEGHSHSKVHNATEKP